MTERIKVVLATVIFLINFLSHSEASCKTIATFPQQAAECAVQPIFSVTIHRRGANDSTVSCHSHSFMKNVKHAIRIWNHEGVVPGEEVGETVDAPNLSFAICEATTTKAINGRRYRSRGVLGSGNSRFLRLINGTLENQGLVQISVHGRWQFVDLVTKDSQNAMNLGKVACRQLGYVDVAHVYFNSTLLKEFHVDNYEVTSMSCTGMEGSLKFCSHQSTQNNSTQRGVNLYRHAIDLVCRATLLQEDLMPRIDISQSSLLTDNKIVNVTCSTKFHPKFPHLLSFFLFFKNGSAVDLLSDLNKFQINTHAKTSPLVKLFSMFQFSASLAADYENAQFLCSADDIGAKHSKDVKKTVIFDKIKVFADDSGDNRKMKDISNKTTEYCRATHLTCGSQSKNTSWAYTTIGGIQELVNSTKGYFDIHQVEKRLPICCRRKRVSGQTEINVSNCITLKQNSSTRLQMKTFSDWSNVTITCPANETLLLMKTSFSPENRTDNGSPSVVCSSKIARDFLVSEKCQSNGCGFALSNQGWFSLLLKLTLLEVCFNGSKTVLHLEYYCLG